MFILNQEDKNKIIGKRYSYYDYDEKTIQKIAEKDVKDLTFEEASTLVQAMYPFKLICSGLFDCFLIFECQDGERIDPPLKAFRDLRDKNLQEEIFKFFEQENIKYHESWNLLKEVLK